MKIAVVDDNKKEQESLSAAIKRNIESSDTVIELFDSGEEFSCVVKDKTFSALSHNSPQQSRFVIGMTIWHELFLAAFETNHISSKNVFAFDSFCL